MNYLDTSALIKRFVAEKGSPLIQRIIEAGSVATAKIAHAEVYAGLKRKKWGFDAVHLASALSLKKALGEEITFTAADERLLRAAKAERLDALNVETELTS